MDIGQVKGCLSQVATSDLSLATIQNVGNGGSCLKFCLCLIALLLRVSGQVLQN